MRLKFWGNSASLHHIDGHYGALLTYWHIDLSERLPIFVRYINTTKTVEYTCLHKHSFRGKNDLWPLSWLQCKQLGIGLGMFYIEALEDGLTTQTGVLPRARSRMQ